MQQHVLQVPHETNRTVTPHCEKRRVVGDWLLDMNPGVMLLGERGKTTTMIHLILSFETKLLLRV